MLALCTSCLLIFCIFMLQPLCPKRISRGTNKNIFTLEYHILAIGNIPVKKKYTLIPMKLNCRKVIVIVVQLLYYVLCCFEIDFMEIEMHVSLEYSCSSSTRKTVEKCRGGVMTHASVVILSSNQTSTKRPHTTALTCRQQH